jgi:hypothetical protein
MSFSHLTGAAFMSMISAVNDSILSNLLKQVGGRMGIIQRGIVQ